MSEIQRIYAENKGRVGYRRITLELHQQGRVVNHKTVQRLMRLHGIVCCVRMKKYKSYKGEVGKTAPNLLERSFEAQPKVGYGRDGVQPVWAKNLSFAHSRFV